MPFEIWISERFYSYIIRWIIFFVRVIWWGRLWSFLRCLLLFTCCRSRPSSTKENESLSITYAFRIVNSTWHYHWRYRNLHGFLRGTLDKIKDKQNEMNENRERSYLRFFRLRFSRFSIVIIFLVWHVSYICHQIFQKVELVFRFYTLFPANIGFMIDDLIWYNSTKPQHTERVLKKLQEQEEVIERANVPSAYLMCSKSYTRTYDVNSWYVGFR